MDIEKLKIEAAERLGFKRDDYFNVAYKFDPEVLSWYIDMAVAIGFDLGTKNNVCHGFKPVIAMKNELSIPFESIRDAERQLKCAHSDIIRSIQKGYKCKGYHFKYA
jgi:hypothetical protein